MRILCIAMAMLLSGAAVWALGDAGAAAPAATPAAGGPVLPQEALVKSQNKTMPPSAPDDSLAPVALSLKIDWSKVIREVPAEVWGINDYEMLATKTAADVGYNQVLADMRPGLIRLHQGGMPDQWLDASKRQWDVDKIKACWAAARVGFGDSKVMLNIASWPDWMNDSQGCIKPECVAAYAQLYADLVRIMRDEVKRPIAYWEITNERDGHYGKLNRLDDLWQIYNAVAVAIKKADPAAKVGGPAFTWPNPAWVEPFAKSCMQNTDFVTYHNYGTGDLFDSNETLYAHLDDFQRQAKYVRDTVDKYAGGRHVEIFLDEYNVKWVWTPIEPRHGNSVGAVFQAGVVRRILLSGIDGANDWHLKGSAYGLIDADNTIRSTAHMFYWANRYLVGKMVDAGVSDNKALEVIAIDRGDGGRSVLIANKLPRTAKLGSIAQLGLSGKVEKRQVTARGSFDSQAAGDLEVPGYSLTLLSTSH